MMIKRLFSPVLAAVFILSLFAGLSNAVYADDDLTVERTDKTPTRVNYDVKVTVRITEDANGWNDAWIGINHTYKGGVTDTEKITGLKKDFDDKKEFSVEKKNWLFPTSVDVYTDFGGGASWRSFQADVTVYVNGVNVASKHISAKSTAFSSSKAKNTITIDESKLPYPTNVYADGTPEVAIIGDDGYVSESYVSMVDQYGSSFQSNDITFGDSEGNDLGNLYPKRVSKTADGKSTDYVNYKIILIMNGEDDKNLDYIIKIPTANSVHSVVTASFSVQYKCMHKVDIVFDGEVRDTKTGAAGDVIALDYPELIQDGFELEWSLQGGGLLDAADDKYVFGDKNGVLTASLIPYSFTVAFDGNGATKGTMTSRIQRVGTTYTLPGNTYTRTGYEFTGWNTEPDGTGDPYPNKSTVRDLSAVKGDTVTLYAQWKVKTYTVTFVNKMTGERIKQTVEYGKDAEAPEIGPFPAEDGHYVFSKWNKAFTAIKSNMTVTSVHVKEPHTFVDEGGEHYCSVCGYGRTDGSMTASVFGSNGVIVIVTVVAVFAAAAVAAVIIKKKNNSKPEEKEE